MKIKKTNILLFLFMFASVPPNVLMLYPAVKHICNVIQILGFLYIVTSMIRRKHINTLTFLFILYDISLLFSTILGNGQIYRCLSEIFNNLGLPFLMVSGLVSNKKLIKTAYYYFSVICTVNLLTLLYGVYVQGIAADNSVFIVDSNGITIYFILALALAVVNKELSRKKSNKSVIWLIVICSVSELLIWSGTGMIAWFAFLGLYAFSQFGEKRRLSYFGGSIVTNVASVVLISAGLSPVFQSFLDFLGKEITLTGRIYIWASAISKFHAAPIMGYGYGEPAFNQYVAHNQILELLVEGGILLLLVFYIIYIFIGIQEKRCPRKITAFKSVSVMKSAIIAVGIDMMTEIEPMMLLFFICSILSYVMTANEGEL